ncbi:putative disease resistance protein RGA1 [Juglans regia]|uniref:Disease resistance protein RGA1 n=1 Tax=Juglans regia TaxID=51240 RepID=A0A6P9EBH3_JUGRE|nr:putative disease resistance protein RGA1 [Juglans regia]
MGGIGKTTLAQLVYNDKQVKNFFDLKAWACVSEDFDVAIVTKTILQSITSSENCDGKDLDWLQVKLKEQLYGKRFLVILDDVWNEKYNDWILLRTPFEAGAPGSSIIVTTRNRGVSSLMGTIKVEPFQLEVLPTDACLSIFSQHALDAKDFSAHPDLKDIGEEIVRKCKGLPLAVKTVGGLLRSTQDRNEWDKVLKSKIWDIPEERSGIAPALMLSYHNLPSHLKRCFAYCSILPKDYEFREKEVVLLWMAEGLIHPRQDEEEMEDLGSEYFRNLLSRSFFQQSSRYDKTRFFMHDLINDLAQSVAGETCFRMEDRVGGSWHENLPIKARHSSYLGSQYDVAKKFGVFSKLISLRTFLPLMLPYLGCCYLARHVQCELVPTIRCLRVLSFNGYRITELSDSISDLKHLRYLNLSHTQISSLPESIATLYNLQTLLLEMCLHLKKLPSMLCNLVNLRHLNIVGANRLEGMPMQIGKLTCLQTLTNLIVGKDNCSGVKELGRLKHLKGELNISRLESVIEPKDTKDAELTKKIKISALSLEWSSDIDELKDRTSELEVLNGLQPHGTLTELGIIDYGGTEFPIWLKPAPSFPHMVSLKIRNCRKCTLLPPLGQLPSLKTLSISGMDSVKSVGSEFCGNNCFGQCFRSLKYLSFENMKEWDNWSPCEEFPNLQSLSLRNCPKLLGKLPNNLPLLKNASIDYCAQLEVSLSCFPDKCRLNTERSNGVVCGSKVRFKLIDLSRSLSPISDEGLDMEELAELEWLSINNYEEVTNLWSDNMGSLPHLLFLSSLHICHCPKQISLVAEEVDQERLQLRITGIVIEDCMALESLPNALMYNNTCLQFICIIKCDSLTHFARSHMPPTLKKLDIRDCKSMRNLVDDDDNDTNNNSNCNSGITSLLEELDVSNCPSLESLTSSGELPTTLLRLNIRECPKLESVAKSFRHNSFLETITISNCENLQLLNGGELLLPSNLRGLDISGCEKMQGLQNGIYNLTSLRDLKIQNCPSILSFPKEGFPTNLTILSISHLKITQAMFDWGLDNLTSLNELQIGGCQHLVSFPKLTSLKTLWIFDCKNLTCFPEDGLPLSLVVLRISNCQKLRSFPKNGLPPSLVELCISNCQKLKSFPKNGLPPSLQQLAIDECPLLEEHCKKDQRGEWSKIADIPYVGINGKYIFGTDTMELIQR